MADQPASGVSCFCKSNSFSWVRSPTLYYRVAYFQKSLLIPGFLLLTFFGFHVAAWGGIWLLRTVKSLGFCVLPAPKGSESLERETRKPILICQKRQISPSSLNAFEGLFPKNDIHRLWVLWRHYWKWSRMAENAKIKFVKLSFCNLQRVLSGRKRQQHLPKLFPSTYDQESHLSATASAHFCSAPRKTHWGWLLCRSL